MAAAYDPALSNDIKKELIKYFLAYKSKVISNGSTCPTDVEDVIRHLQTLLNSIENNSPRSETRDWQKNISINLVVGVLITVIGGVILHKITS
ncbi:hypothetical protein [Vibrio cholerae]|uniref:hypothetical protein n=1 Tax=Vibrio cholerae TaxID=666 RepID=UPI00308014C3